MTYIEDAATSIKDPERCKIIEKELRKKFMVHESFTMIADEVLQLTLARCEGNPLISMHFLCNLI